MAMDYGIQRTPKAPVYQGGDTFVPGVGVLGPDINGAAKGDMLRQEYELNQNKDARAEESLQMNKDYLSIAQEDLGIRKEDLSMRKEKQGWERDTRDREKQIQTGMATAAQTGGYSGVVDFLKEVDPERAIQFHSEKLKLDNSIMQNEVFQKTLPNEKAKAMFESYGILGKMGTALLNAPADQRDGLYKTMLPMVKQVNPDAPNELNQDAVNMFQLGVAQNTPENILYASQKSSALLDTEVGKYTKAEQELLKQGATPENSQALQDVRGHLQALRDKDTQAGIHSFESQSKINDRISSKDERIQKNTESFNNNLDSKSKDFNAALADYVPAKDAIEQLKTNPDNPYYQSLLGRMFVKSINKGSMSLSDEALQDGVTGLEGFNKKLQSAIGPDGLKKVLAPIEIQLLGKAWESSMAARTDRQKGIEGEFMKSADEYSNVNQKALRLPSQQYDKIQQNSINNEILAKNGFNKVPNEYKPQLLEAIKEAKKNPEIMEYVKAKYKEIQAQQEGGDQ